MSRHLLPAAEHLEVVVGWDPPLRTFFAQVWDRSLDEDDPAAELLWIGCMPGEIRDPQTIRTAVAPWAPLTDEILRALTADHQGS